MAKYFSQVWDEVLTAYSRISFCFLQKCLIYCWKLLLGDLLYNITALGQRVDLCGFR